MTEMLNKIDIVIMRKNLLILFFLFSIKLFPNENNFSWGGNWTVEDDNIFRSEQLEIPFYSELFNDILVIYNKRPDRIIFYEVIDTFGNVLKNGCVSKENSAQITISVSDLSNNGIYTIILTSPVPYDKVWSQFEK